MTDSNAISAYLAHIGRKGGRANSPAQLKHRRQVVKTMLKARHRKLHPNSPHPPSLPSQL
jgi:hypothetical protein